MKDCEMIKALLPMYIEGECNDEVKVTIENHLSTCSECQKEYEAMTAEIIPMPIGLPEAEQINPFKKIKQLNRRKNIIIIVTLTIVIIAAAIFTVKYMEFKNGITVYCHRNPISVFEAIIDRFFEFDKNSRISIVLDEKEGNILDYNNRTFEIYDENKNQYYQVANKDIGDFDNVRVKVVPELKKKVKPDSLQLGTVVNIIKSVLAEVDLDERKMAIIMHSYKRVLNFDVKYYYDAINNTFVSADEFAESRENHNICLIYLIEPKDKEPKEDVLMEKDLRIIDIAVIY